MNEQQARHILEKNGIDIDADGNGFGSSSSPYVSWRNKLHASGRHEVTLDDGFNVDVLEAMAWWIRNKGVPEKPEPWAT